MPKELKEIRNFNQGTILNASERDIPGDSNVYSLNLDPLAEHGILDSIKSNKFITTIDSKDTYFRDPVSWSATNNIDSNTGNDSYNYPGIYIQDISPFEDEGVSKVHFIGTKGRKEELLVKSIEPIFEDTTENITLDNHFEITDTYFTDAGWSADNLEEGEYFSLGNSFSGRYGNFEILKFESYDSATNRIHVKRRCFGTASTRIASGVAQDLWASRNTIGGTQYRAYSGTGILSGWSDYSGNHIGGNSHHLNYCSAVADRAANGYIITDGSNSTVLFDATAGTITFGTDIPDVNFYEGDIITTYYNGGEGAELNCDKSFKIIKKALSPLVLTVEGFDGDTMTTDNLGSGVDFYMESNIVKNFTMSHSINVSSSIGASSTKKFNSWFHTRIKPGFNYLEDSTTNQVVWTRGTFGTDDAFGVSNLPYTSGDSAQYFYPFTDADSASSDTTRNDSFIQITSYYSNSGMKGLKLDTGATMTTDISELEFIVGFDDIGETLAEGDYIFWNAADYMKVLSVDGNKIQVNRKQFGTAGSVSGMTNTATPSKNLFNSIRQIISKDKFKEGQEYTLSFYAQGRDEGATGGSSGDADENEAVGALSISFNGGYITSNGEWSAYKKDSKSGFMKSGNEKEYAQNYRWINFTDCTKPNQDSTTQTEGLDHVWRRFDFRFTIPKGQKLESDVTLEMASIGIHNSNILLDRITINEHTKIYTNSSSSKNMDNSAFINNTSSKTLVTYDASSSTLSILDEFSISDYATSSIVVPKLSQNASANILSSRNSATFIANNREVHAGFGGSSSDSSPQWLGYVNHKVFGEDNTKLLYQDEDTVHSYDDAAINTLSKICLAGEFECKTVAISNAGSSNATLEIEHASHPFETGDNIVIREWMDADNSWNGSGVWVVTDKDPGSDGNSFTVGRNTVYSYSEVSAPSNNLVSYRPYYYYGCKDGDDRIYRVTPSDRIKSNLSVDSEYTAGTMEACLSLPSTIKSITTCHNKVDGGTGGGRIYALSDNSDEVFVVDANIAYNKWKSTTPSTHGLTLVFKSFKWSNDDVTGDLSNGDAVFDSVASVSTPTISYAGNLSDILETKGTGPSFDIDASANNANSPNDFDTRLWIQCAPASGSAFTEGSRFLFCGLTNNSNADSAGTIYCGDRTPPTTHIVDKVVEYMYADNSAHSWRMEGGPGVKYSNTANGGRSKYGYWTSGYVYGMLEDIKAIRTPSTASNTNVQSSGTDKAYYSFGENIGWHKDDINDDSDLVAIEVAKYGLFQMGDNDLDGMIDNTGVVCANNKSIQGHVDHTNDASIKLYGDLHRRVTSHVVGLIGKADKPWVRFWGKVARETGDNHWYWWYEEQNSDSHGRYGMDAPAHMHVNGCIFICADMHFGDKSARYGASTYSYPVASSDVVDCTGVLANWNGQAVMMTLTADQLENSGLQAGDAIFCLNTDTRTKSFNTYVAGVVGKGTNPKIILPVACHQNDDSTPKYADDAYRIFPHSQFPLMNGQAAGDGIAAVADASIHGMDVEDNLKIYHYAFNDADKGDGTIFTEGYGCGKYGRTFLSYNPSGLRGDDTVGASSGGFTYNPWKPGFSFTIDKLNFRAGFMIRPFTMETNNFEDLAIGNNLCIESPCWPSLPVYHKENAAGSLIHYSVGDTNTESQFANKVFITNKQEELDDSTSGNQCKVYQVDMSLMYPELALHKPLPNMLHATWTGDDANGWPQWDIMCAGNIIEYIDTYSHAHETTTPISSDDAHQQPRLNADNCPIIVVRGTSTNMIHGEGIFGTNSPYRNNGQLTGMCISVVDNDTGKVQTRYIVWAHNVKNSSTSGKNELGNMYLHVHYPFSHKPTSSDKFYIWNHALVCTAPVRLYKETTLSHTLPNANKATPDLAAKPYLKTGELDLASNGTTATATTDDYHGIATGDDIKIFNALSDYNNTYSVTVTGPKEFQFTTTASGISNSTGEWELINEKGSTSNPLILELADPITLTTFGGLDMSKTRFGAVSGIADSSDDIRLTGTNHRLSVGDTITYISDSVTAQNGTYIVKEGGGTLPSATEDTFEVANKTSTDVPGDWFTNQWESVLFETGGKAGITELRSGLFNWDKGNISGNIIRHDSTADADIYMAFTEGNVNITSGASSASGDYFKKNTDYQYKISLIYDGYQEGLLSTTTWNYSSTSTANTLYLDIKVSNYSKRLSHVCVYRRDSSSDFFSLVKEIKTESGWGNTDGVWVRSIADNGTLGPTYESRSGLSEVLDTIKIKYGISTEVDGYLFAGDCSHENIENASNFIFRSKPGKYSIFDYANDFLTIKSKPTAMANFLGRLFVFDDNNIYKINQHDLSIEDIFEGVGCLGKDSVIVTEYGMFFADSNGAYMHDGNKPIRISEAIHQGEVDTSFGGSDNVYNVSWVNLISNTNNIPLVTFESNSSSVLFLIKHDKKISKTIDSIEANTSIANYYAWSYNIPNERWDLWEIDSNINLGAPVINKNGEVLLPMDNAIYELKGGSTKKDYTWISKKINADQDSIVKIFKKIKINGIEDSLLQGGDYKESSDRILVFTSKGAVSSGNMTYSKPSSSHSEYKISGSNKSARWIQVKLEDMTESIDSLGIIFRRKRVT